MIKCIDPKQDFIQHEEQILEAIKRVCDSGSFILNTEVNAFEIEFAEYIGVPHAIGVANGTDAIFLALKSLNIGIGDEVISVSHTATATIAAIEATGARVVFADIETLHMTLDAASLEGLITPKTRAILAVHIYGNPCDMDALKTIAKEKGLYLIEDCAQATGAEYKGSRVGGIGHIGCFSFFPTKNLGAIGDGGMITTKDSELFQKMLRLRQYGWDDERNCQFPGYNSRLDELQAAVLRIKLRHLNEKNKKRNVIAVQYTRLLSGTRITTPSPRDKCLHAFHLYVIRTRDRDNLLQKLKDNQIQALIHYKLPVHMQSYYLGKANLKHTTAISREILSLPMHPALKEGCISRVCEVITDHLS
jgi:dTDP-4-amino-4,6-dideoxygalactose transaminase